MSDIITKKKILVADDNVAIVHVIKIILEQDGYEVETTYGDNILERVKKEQPDLILLDIWMSGVDGRDVCKDLKKHPLTNHIPIIMISANNDTAIIAKEAGSDDFLPKPFEIDDLLSKVEKLLLKL